MAGKPAKFFYVRNPKSNQTFEVREKELPHYKLQGCEVLGEVLMPSDAPVDELPMVDSAPADSPELKQPVGFICGECQKSFKSQSGLKRHGVTAKHNVHAGVSDNVGEDHAE